jgi:hypothetical protein
MARSDDAAVQLRIEAQLTALEKAFNKANNIVDLKSRQMEKRAQQMANKIEASAGKVDLGRAFDKVFDSSKLKVLDSGAARISVFGSALEDLGPYGIAAAAGITAVVSALAGAREAARFADDIGDTADRLHVTTDALQEYRYAIRAAGGEEQGADEALEGFSVTLGKAQQGLAKGQRAFLALGFTKDQIKGFRDADDALAHVVERISGLPSQQKDAIIQQLGLEGIKPLIEKGTAAMRELRAEARRVGIVMDSDLVKRGGELNDKFETLEKVIDVQIKSALVDLGPILLNLLGIADDLAKRFSAVVDSFKTIQDKSTEGLQRDLANLESQKKTGKVSDNVFDRSVGLLGGPGFIAGNAEKTLRFIKGLVPGQLNKDIGKTQAELLRRQIEEKFVNAQGGGGTDTLTDTSGGGAQRRDHTQDALNAATISAQRGILQSLLNLTDDIQSRASIQKELIDLEEKSHDQERDQQIEDVKTNARLTAAQKAKALASIVAIRAAQAEAAASEKRSIDAEALIATEHKRLEHKKDLADAEIDQLQAQEELTTNVKDRADIELKILAIRKRIADAEAAQVTADKQHRADAATNDGSQTVVVADPSVQRARDKAADAKAEVVRRSADGPLSQWVRGIEDLDTAMQNAAVNGLNDFNDGLARTIVEGGKASDVLHSLINRLLEDIINSQLQQAEKGVLSLLGFDGGGFTGAGPRVGGVDGKGGFPAILHPNETVIDHTRPMNFAIPDRSAANGPPVFHFDLRGAVLTQDLLDQMNQIGQTAAITGARGGSALAQMQMAQRQRRKLGG